MLTSLVVNVAKFSCSRYKLAMSSLSSIVANDFPNKFFRHNRKGLIAYQEYFAALHSRRSTCAGGTYQGRSGPLHHSATLELKMRQRYSLEQTLLPIYGLLKAPLFRSSRLRMDTCGKPHGDMLRETRPAYRYFRMTRIHRLASARKPAPGVLYPATPAPRSISK